MIKCVVIRLDGVQRSEGGSGWGLIRTSPGCCAALIWSETTESPTFLLSGVGLGGCMLGCGCVYVREPLLSGCHSDLEVVCVFIKRVSYECLYIQTYKCSSKINLLLKAVVWQITI